MLTVGETGADLPPAQVEVVAPHFKRRLSGVTSTIIQLVPAQSATGLGIVTLGPGLPDELPRLRYSDLWRLWRPPAMRRHRIWHARRNVEMVGGLLLRTILRMPLKLVFTSASQRDHRPFTKWLIGQMDEVVATSAKTASYLEVPNRVVRHGIDTDRFTPPDDLRAAKKAVGLDPDQKHIGCFGRIRSQKGTDLFVDSVIPVLRDNPDWVAVIAGRATVEHSAFEQDLKEKARAAGLGSRILFAGEHRDIDRWYKALDLFVAPQRWEGFGLTPLEAMASGVPVVATDVGAFSELIVEGKTGFVLRDMQPSTMASAVRRLVADDDLRETMAAASRRHVEQYFSLRSEVEALAEVYDAAAPRKSSSNGQSLPRLV